jgi:hypothetical protein
MKNMELLTLDAALCSLEPTGYRGARLVTATIPFTDTINMLPFPRIHFKGPVVHIHVPKIRIKSESKATE